jgi:hypothetical protein
MSAILKSPIPSGIRMLFAGCWLSTLVPANGFAEDANSPTNNAGFRQEAEREYLARKTEYHRAPTNAAFACAFGRACFERAEYSTNATERAVLAEQGAGACREVIRRDSNSAPARLYLAMNLGQLARTRTLGALSLVDEMERQFQSARRLDEHLDHAAPDRYLGVLYREAPVIVSVGDRTKSRRHLLRAVQLAPEFPVNRLNLVESFVLWGEKVEGRRELKKLETLLPAARTNFTGASWAATWADWNPRITRVQQTLQD